MVEGSGAVERFGAAESILVATLRVAKVPLAMVDAGALPMRLKKRRWLRGRQVSPGGVKHWGGLLRVLGRSGDPCSHSGDDPGL